MSFVSEYPVAAPEVAIAHFSGRLALETDCADVNACLKSGDLDFVLLHVVGSPDDTLFVVYCAGPHCNGADQAALKLARLGRKVKLMIGGIAGWADEGLAFETGLDVTPQIARIG